MSWFFSGLGTFLLGLILGVGGDRLVIKISQRNHLVQRQKAGSNANQLQVGHDLRSPSNED